MSLTLLFACLFTMPAGALASRTTAKEAQDVPWNKKGVVGTLLGVVSMGDAVAGFSVPGAVSKPSHRMASARGDTYDQVQTLLVDVFGGRGPVDQAACGKLMDSLRNNTKVGDTLVKKLQETLSGPDFKSSPIVLDKNVIWKGGEQLDVHQTGGDSVGVSIVRYSPLDQRTSEWVSGMHRHMLSLHMSKLVDGLFLPYFAQSHTFEDFIADTEEEMFFMLELYYGTVREVMQAHDLTYQERMDLFLETFRVVQRLNRVGIRHTSDITPDTVLVRGGFTGSLEGKVVLKPDLIHILSTSSQEEMWLADVRKLGTLLRFLMRGDFPEDVQPKIDVFRAFGKAMESGAFAGERNVETEFDDLWGRMNSGILYLELVHLKSQYSRWSMEAEVLVGQRKEEAAE